MSFTVRLEMAGEEKVNIFIEGDLIVRDAAAIKNELLSILQTHTNADISLQNISKIDVAGLQLLAALSISAIAANKTFRLFAGNSASLQNKLQISGFSYLFQNYSL